MASGGTFLSQPTIIYVDAINGDDEFDGHRIISPMRTIRAAVAQANTPDGNGGYIGDGWIIYCAPGVYQEEAGIEVYARNLSIKGLDPIHLYPSDQRHRNNVDVPGGQRLLPWAISRSPV